MTQGVAFTLAVLVFIGVGTVMYGLGCLIASRVNGRKAARKRLGTMSEAIESLSKRQAADSRAQTDRVGRLEKRHTELYGVCETLEKRTDVSSAAMAGVIAKQFVAGLRSAHLAATAGVPGEIVGVYGELRTALRRAVSANFIDRRLDNLTERIQASETVAKSDFEETKRVLERIDALAKQIDEARLSPPITGCVSGIAPSRARKGTRKR